jgi:hypothetical protein
VSKLKEYVRENGQSSAVVDVPTWLARTTLDAIGVGEQVCNAALAVLTVLLCSGIRLSIWRA